MRVRGEADDDVGERVDEHAHGHGGEVDSGSPYTKAAVVGPDRRHNPEIDLCYADE